MKNKIIASLLLSVSLLGLTACGEEEDKTTASSSSTEEVKKEDNKKEDWNYYYKGTKLNKKTEAIKDASSYANSKTLGTLKGVDDENIELKHLAVSTKIKDLQGKDIAPGKGKAFIVASWKVENKGNSDVFTGVPNISVLDNNDNKLIKEKSFYHDDKLESKLNTKEQNDVLEKKEGSFKPGTTYYLNSVYELPQDCTRFTVIEKSNHYSDLNNMVFENMNSSRININEALQKQQES